MNKYLCVCKCVVRSTGDEERIDEAAGHMFGCKGSSQLNWASGDRLLFWAKFAHAWQGQKKPKSFSYVSHWRGDKVQLDCGMQKKSLS